MLSLLLNLAVVAEAGLYVVRTGFDVTLQKVGLQDPPRPDFPRLGVERFGALPGAEVAFVGDSQVQNAPLAELVGEVAQRGIGGQTVADTAAWLDVTLDDDGLQRLVVWVGTNDVIEGHDPDRVRADMAALLAQIDEERPDVDVVLLSVPPLRDYPGKAGPVNQALEEAANEADATWVDVTGRLGSDGLMDVDGAHITPAGYVAIAPALRQAAG